MIFLKIDIEVTNSEIEAYHRLTNRKFVQRILEKKNEVNLEGIGFPAGSCIYFDENLKYRDIWMKARLLKKEKLSLYLWTDNGCD